MLSLLSSLLGAKSVGEAVSRGVGTVPPLILVIASYPEQRLGEGSVGYLYLSSGCARCYAYHELGTTHHSNCFTDRPVNSLLISL